MIQEKEDGQEIAFYLKERLVREIQIFKKMKTKQYLKQRYMKFREMGDVIHEH